MPSIDIDTLSYDELIEHRQEVNHRIDKLEEDAITKLQQQAHAFGFVLAKPGRPNGVKYQNPENPDETYGGKGKRPKWLVDKIEAGHSLDEFRAAY